MKQFFVFLCVCLMCFPLCVMAQEEGHTEPDSVPLAFMDVLSRYAAEQTENLVSVTPETYQENHAFSIMTPLMWMRSEASPLSGRQGYGDWVNHEFGRARIMSCTSGIQGMTSVYTGVQIELHSGWRMAKPWTVIPSTKGASHEEVFSLTRFAGEPQQDERDFFIPIQTYLTDPVSALEIAVRVQGQVVRDNQAPVGVDIPLFLSLTDEAAHYTPLCAHMIQMLQQVAIPTDPVDLNARLFVEEDRAVLMFRLPFESEWAYIQHKDDTPVKIDAAILNKKTFSFSLPLCSEQKSEEGCVDASVLKPMTYKILTPQQWYQITLIPKFRVAPALVSDVSWLGWFFSGFLLVLFSPFLPYLLLLRSSSAKAYAQHIRKTWAYLMGTMILLSVVFGVVGIPLIEVVQIHWAVSVIVLILMIGFVVRPFHSLRAIFCLFLIAPHPYLMGILGVVPFGRAGYFFLPVLWMIWFSVVMGVLYSFAQPLRRFLNRLDKVGVWQVRALILLPWMGLILWLIVGLIGYARAPVDQTAPIDVQLVRPVICPSCDLVEYAFKSRTDVAVRRVSPLSALGIDLMGQANRRTWPLIVMKNQAGTRLFLPSEASRRLLLMVDKIYGE